jgi:hypothetical protein
MIQSFLTIGAMMLFALISLTFNTVVLQNTTLEIENKVYLTAFSLADDLIEEIKQKSFDEETLIFRSINADELTEYNYFGPDSGETSQIYFDDIDDYNNYTKSISVPHVEGYTVTSKVYYGDIDNPDQNSLTQTFFKRVEVTVDSDYFSFPVTLYHVFTLHSKGK